MAKPRSACRSKKMRGGQSVASTALPVDSANSYVLSQYGEGNTQWDNVFGPQSTSVMGNEIVNLQHSQQNPAMLYTMKGGKRRTRRMRKRGGQVINAASVAPFALWGMQNMYSRRKSRKSGSKRRRRRR